MSRYVFDLESDGLLDQLTKIHSLVLKDIDTGDVESFTPQHIEEGVRLLQRAEQIIGHNIIKFDIPALQKVFPWFNPEEAKVRDTLVCTRLIWSDIFDKDLRNIRSNKIRMPMKLAGSHSLEAWGWRLGNWKGDYSKQKEDEYLEYCHLEGLPKPSKEEIAQYVWAEWSQEMQDYCEQDVEVTEQLWELICGKNYSQEAIDLEHDVAWIIAQQERNGFGFDLEAAEKLYHELTLERIELEESLTSLFEPWWAKDGTKTKKWARTMRMKDGTIRLKDAEYTPVKQVIFNPGSRDHIADRLQRVKGWKPKDFTEGGKPKVDETVLSQLPWPEAKQLAKYFQVKKILGQLGDGDKAWLKFAKNGKIHHNVNTNGAVSGRATHSFPNIAQVPSGRAYKGKECRALFRPLDPSHVQVGCDVSGLELRMLGHFMAKYDGGEYGRQVVEGDVHWVNVQALGLVPEGTERDEHKFIVHAVFRDGTKTFIYGFLYGAGDEKVGSLVLEIAAAEEERAGASSVRARFFQGKRRVGSRQLRQTGRRLKADFLEKTPALKKLIEGVKKAANTKGYLRGLDGRFLHVRSDHAALNVLLQSAGALVCKRWLVEFHKLLRENNLHNVCFQMAWVHDEVQLSVVREYADEVGKLCVQAIENTQQHFNIRVPLTGEYKVGENWRDCH